MRLILLSVLFASCIIAPVMGGAGAAPYLEASRFVLGEAEAGGGTNRPFEERSVLSVNRISDLRGLRGARGQRVFVAGYSVKNDGGQGTFAWNEAFIGSDDGGVNLVPKRGTGTGGWERQFVGSVRPEWFGARCDGHTDDTNSVQETVNYVGADGARSSSIELGDCTLRLTKSITVTSGLRIIGEGVSPYEGTLGTPGRGSWLFFDHPGVGIRTVGGRQISGLEFERLGTRRNQPEPGAGWKPCGCDFDFVMSDADVLFDDVMLLNPTKGIKIDKGHYGRLRIERLRGQPLEVGIEVEESYDTFIAHDVKFWPFWRDIPSVHSYTLQHLDAFWLLRADNPMMSDVFTIFAHAGIRFSQNTYGKVSKLHLANADFDRGLFGLWVDSSVTSGVTGQADNVTIQGETDVPLTKGIICVGSDGRMSFGNLSIAVSDQNAIRIEGRNNNYQISNLEIQGYDLSGSGFPAVEALMGNSITIMGLPDISGGRSGVRYGGEGEIRVRLAQGRVKMTTDAAGDILVKHGSGVVPTIVLAQQVASEPSPWAIVSVTASNFVLRTYKANGTPLADAEVTYYWRAEK
jgi:hypothetical protein